MRKKEDLVMEEMDNFFEENEKRSKKFKLLIDGFDSGKDINYKSLPFSIGEPLKKKFFKKMKISRAKDHNSKDNLF